MWDEFPKSNPQLILSKKDRLQNLYKITDKSGNLIPFTLNWAQIDLLDNFWFQMLILKARQIGCTTFFAINFLDDCFWMQNINAGIIAHRREDAENIFKNKVKLAYENMPEWTKQINSAKNDRVGELNFKNGSNYRVSTGFRSGTNQRLLVSEFGKICAKSPDVAKEIVTGSLNTVGKDQMIVIESTAEGREGYFYDFSKEAENLAIDKVQLSPMQMRFFFFPWFKEPAYSESDLKIIVSEDTNKYIDLIEMETGASININQRRWYELKSAVMGDSMKQEYPSTPKEAFEASNEGLYYGAIIAKMRREGKICKVPYQESFPVHCSFDLGYDDHTVIWFFQLAPGGVINVIDCYEHAGEDAKYYCNILKNRGYTYGTIVLPHDGKKMEGATATSWEAIFTSLMNNTRIHVLENHPGALLEGLNCVRATITRCYFDEVKCKQGLKCLEAYKKEWNDKLGCYSNRPLHDWSSHASDSFRYLCVALDQGIVAGTYMSKEKLDKIKMQQGFGPKNQGYKGPLPPFTGR
jgi:hypothetical protein